MPTLDELTTAVDASFTTFKTSAATAAASNTQAQTDAAAMTSAQAALHTAVAALVVAAQAEDPTIVQTPVVTAAA